MKYSFQGLIHTRSIHTHKYVAKSKVNVLTGDTNDFNICLHTQNFG